MLLQHVMKMRPGKILNRSKGQHPPMVIVDKNGLEGTAIEETALPTDPESRLLVRFENGEQVIVPRELLTRQQDGRYHLAVSIEELLANQEVSGPTDTFYSKSIAPSADATEEIVVPITEEQVSVQKRVFETGKVEIRKTVHERTELVDLPVHIDEVEIERVPVNRLVDEPVPVRQEGDTTILPLLEEVLVIEKRLVLREEVHIKKLQKEVHNPQEMQLREERVEIVRKPSTNQTPTQGDGQES